MRTRRKLKKWVKITLIAALFLVFIILLIKVVNYSFNKCDNEKGYTCTVYDLRGNN